MMDEGEQQYSPDGEEEMENEYNDYF